MTSHRFTRTIKRAGLLAGMSAALLLVVDPAAARPREWPLQQVEQDAEAEPLVPAQDQLAPAQGGGGVSLQQATAMARMRYPGTVVRAETVQMGDRLVHEIRILGDDGRVRTVRIDARTGAFL
jgi:uncharacterized membrane protein YkoI